MKFSRMFFVIVAALFLMSASAAPQASAPAKSAKKGQSAKTETKSAAEAGLLDINSATEAQLKELPGIGDAYAAKIVKNRPYRAKNELVTKKVIPEKTYTNIKDKIIAKQK